MMSFGEPQNIILGARPTEKPPSHQSPLVLSRQIVPEMAAWCGIFSLVRLYATSSRSNRYATKQLYR